jgi:hypothetical protein
MTQNPQTPSGTSFDEPDPILTTSTAAYDDSTSVTSASPTGTGSTSAERATTSTSTVGGPAPGSGTSSTVRDEAASVGADAAEGGRRVAGTAASEVKDVVGEARSQLSTLLEQLRDEASHQASGQSDRAVKGLRSLGDELKQMVSASEQRGMATDLAGQAADRVQSVAGWLEQRRPGEVLDEVRDFARRRPGTFLAAAAVVGLIGGRLTRGLTASSGSSSSTQSRAAVGGGISPTPGYAALPATSVGTDPTTYAQPRTAMGDAEGVQGAALREGLR